MHYNETRSSTHQAHQARERWSDNIFVFGLCLVMFTFLIKDSNLVYPSEVQSHSILILTTTLAALFATTNLTSRIPKTLTLSIADLVAFALLSWIAFSSLILNPVSLQSIFVTGTILSYLVLRQLFTTQINKLEIVSVSILITGVLQVLTAGLQLFDVIPTQGLYKIVGGFDNPGPLGICLSSILVFSTCLYKRTTTPFVKSLSFITCLSCILVLPASDSRAAWVGLTAGSFFLLTKEPVWHRFKESSIFKPAVGTFMAILFVFGLLLWRYKEDSGLGRVLIWQISSNLILDRPLTGTGLGHFRYRYPHYQAEYFASPKFDINSKEVLLSDMVEYAFCDILQFAAESGVPGAIILTFFLSILIFFPLNANPYASAARGAIITIATAGLVSYPFQLASTWWLFLVYAMIVSCSLTQSVTFKFKPGLIPRFATLCLLIVVLCKLNQLTVVNYQAKRKWHQAQKAFQEGQLSVAEKRFEEVLTDIPYDKEPLLFYGKILMLAQKNQEASNVFKAAATDIADPFLHCNLGDVSTRLGDFATAEESYTIATRITPNRMYPKYLLALHYSRIGNSSKVDSLASHITRMPVKVRSSATDEMRAEIQKVMQQRRQ